MNTKSILSSIFLFLVLGIGAIYIWSISSDQLEQQSPVEFSDEEPIVSINETTATIEQKTTKSQKGDVFSVFDEPQITDGEKHIVALNQIQSGGVGKDGIPAIDDPQFISIDEANSNLSDQELGVAVSINGIDRFYPFQILVWHEIVNDKFADQRVLITYCPLCFASVVFEPVVEGEEVEFGVSGKLWNSNLVMYDRKNENYWSQILGTAIVGPQAGKTLKLLPSDQLTYGNWKEAFPDGEVLSRETGAKRFYGKDPYGSYYANDEDIFFTINNEDTRLERKEYVLGIVIDNEAKAYLPASIQAAGEVIDEFNGRQLQLIWDKDLEVVRIFDITDPEEEPIRINPFAQFWFSWAAAHPNTLLYK